MGLSDIQVERTYLDANANSDVFGSTIWCDERGLIGRYRHANIGQVTSRRVPTPISWTRNHGGCGHSDRDGKREEHVDSV